MPEYARPQQVSPRSRQPLRTAATCARLSGGGDHALQLQTSALPPPPADHEGLLGRPESSVAKQADECQYAMIARFG